MSQNITSEAPAISLSDIQAHPSEAIAALVEIARQQQKEIKLLQDNIGIALDLIAKLRSKVEPEPSKTQATKGEVLRAILMANGRKMMSQDARKRLGMDKASFSRLITSMSQEITVKRFHADKRQTVIILNG